MLIWNHYYRLAWQSVRYQLGSYNWGLNHKEIGFLGKSNWIDPSIFSNELKIAISNFLFTLLTVPLFFKHAFRCSTSYSKSSYFKLVFNSIGKIHYPHIFGLRIFLVHFNDMYFHFLDTRRSFIEGHNFIVYKMIYKYLGSSWKYVFRRYKHSIKRTRLCEVCKISKDYKLTTIMFWPRIF